MSGAILVNASPATNIAPARMATPPTIRVPLIALKRYAGRVAGRRGSYVIHPVTADEGMALISRRGS